MEQIGQQQVSTSISDQEILFPESDSESSSSSNSGRFGFLTRSGMIRLERESQPYKTVKECLINGMGLFGKDTFCVAIHKNPCSDPAGRARVEKFGIFSMAVAEKNGGNANVKLAWYGASREEICEIISHGFSRCNTPENGGGNGIGVYLAPLYCAMESVMASAVDGHGLRHLFLCRVILGKMEEIGAGSNQSQPSSEEFHTGVDSHAAPQRYIIWGAYMNSHIIPTYVVSLRARNNKGFEKPKIPTVESTSLYVQASALVSKLSTLLPPPIVVLLQQYHNDFKANRISKAQLVQRLKEVAGEKLLVVVMKFYSNREIQLGT